MLDKFAIALISPLGTALFLGVLAIACGLRRMRRIGIASGIAAVAWLYLWSLPPVADGFQGWLESQNPPLPVASIPTAPAIVVLGGGLSGNLLPPEAGQPLNLGSGADRVWFASRLYHLGKAPLVVVSGGNYFPTAGATEAEAMTDFLVDLGVPQSAIIQESRSRNTRENAAFSAQLLTDKGISRVLLVTSALHMTRAKLHFEEEGLRVFPAPTDFEASRVESSYWFLPNTEALDASGRALKEWVGQIVF